jgi:Holliday junction resolvase RusA-like endonuclease
MSEYVVIGDPIPLARARHGSGRTWDPQKHLKLHWGLMLADQHKNQAMFEGPIHMEIIFFMSKPKTSIKKRSELQGQSHYYKPDLDNLVKWAVDCGNGIFYKDDSIVASISCKKVYDDQPRTFIKIVEIK